MSYFSHSLITNLCGRLSTAHHQLVQVLQPVEKHPTRRCSSASASNLDGYILEHVILGQAGKPSISLRLRPDPPPPPTAGRVCQLHFNGSTVGPNHRAEPVRDTGTKRSTEKCLIDCIVCNDKCDTIDVSSGRWVSSNH
mmetsp:Transcript_19840/g.60188  ORF Transcript_19840/g.60188 Transcript_19840/m.60188 type:complete len:139 (+) Transcript_19840:3-419(+)